MSSKKSRSSNSIVAVEWDAYIVCLFSNIQVNGNTKHDSLENTSLFISVYMINHSFKPMFNYGSSTVMMAIFSLEYNNNSRCSIVVCDISSPCAGEIYEVCAEW